MHFKIGQNRLQVKKSAQYIVNQSLFVTCDKQIASYAQSVEHFSLRIQ
jgi:hypothetical protein